MRVVSGNECGGREADRRKRTYARMGLERRERYDCRFNAWRHHRDRQESCISQKYDPLEWTAREHA